MVLPLLDTRAEWLSGPGPDADVALCTECALSRNLADFPFPNCCTDEELQLIVDRVVTVLDSFNLLESGKLLGPSDLTEEDTKVLFERRLIGRAFRARTGPRAVFVADDQSFSVAINDANHIVMRALTAGVQPHEAWQRLNLIDDTLAGGLDYAFSERLGYLTSSLNQVGTGLKAAVLLHLPGIVMIGAAGRVAEELRDKRHTLEPIYAKKDEALGDLYRLENMSTLGRSEEETYFHVRHLAGEVIAQEHGSRKGFMMHAPRQIEDRVGRAWGTARYARLMGFAESLSVLSSLRLGVSENLLDHVSPSQLNEAYVASHSGHFEAKCGGRCDELTINTLRADMFRARFS